MRSPLDLGLPAKFAKWRPYQRDAMLTVAAAGDGDDGLNMPTGSGKSAVYMALAKLLEARVVILTSTKGLQDQLAEEFPYAVDIRGQSNYDCELELPAKVGVDQAVCHLGVPCALKGGACAYFAAYRRAIKAKTVVTNYPYWLSVHEYAEGLGGFDLIICDEAHNSLDKLSDHLSTRVTDREIDAFLSQRKPSSRKKRDWKSWALSELAILEPKLETETRELRRRSQNRSMMRRVHEIRRVVKKLKEVENIAESSQRWVYEEGDTLSWTPVWPGRGSWTLFRDIRQRVLVSATLIPKTMDLLGLRDYRFIEYPSTFPVENRPVIHLVSGVRMRYDTSRSELRAWVDKIDQIIKFRLDRKGIIHTVSYARRDFLLDHSRYRGYMITHARRDTRRKVQEFKRMKGPAILVSPSMDTGYDFPYTECEYQIISKIPFPDSRSPVLAARHKDDKEYGKYVAMVTMVQAAGRGCRAADDRCQTFIVDDQADWFVRRNKKFAPKWFLDSYQPNVMATPPPLPKLEER